MKLFKFFLISCMSFSFLFVGYSFAARRRRVPNIPTSSSKPQRELVRRRDFSEPKETQKDYSKGIEISINTPWEVIQKVVWANDSLKQQVYQDEQVREVLVNALLKKEFTEEDIDEKSREEKKLLFKALIEDPSQLDIKMQSVFSEEAIRIAIGNVVSRIAANNQKINSALLNEVLEVVRTEKVLPLELSSDAAMKDMSSESQTEKEPETFTSEEKPSEEKSLWKRLFG